MSLEDYEKAKGKYIIDEKNLDLIKPTSRILHPLPHVEEINLPIAVESEDKRVAYFRQAENPAFSIYSKKALRRVLRERVFTCSSLTRIPLG